MRESKSRGEERKSKNKEQDEVLWGGCREEMGIGMRYGHGSAMLKGWGCSDVVALENSGC